MPKHPPVDLVLGRSVIGWRLAMSLHFMAGVVPLFSACGIYTVGLWPLLALSLRRSYWRFMIAPDRPVATVRFHNEEWQLFLRLPSGQKQWLPCELYGERLVTPFLTILTFRDSRGHPETLMRQWRPSRLSKRISVVIFGDAVAREPFRQLRVLLRHT